MCHFCCWVLRSPPLHRGEVEPPAGSVSALRIGNAILRIDDRLAGSESSILPIGPGGQRGRPLWRLVRPNMSRPVPGNSGRQGVRLRGRVAELPPHLVVVVRRGIVTEAVLRILTVLSLLLILRACGTPVGP